MRVPSHKSAYNFVLFMRFFELQLEDRCQGRARLWREIRGFGYVRENTQSSRQESSERQRLSPDGHEPRLPELRTTR